MKLITGLLALLPLAGFSQQNFSIKGLVGKTTRPATAWLSYMKEEGQMVTDSSVLKNGVFSFKGTVKEPVMGRIIMVHEGEDKLTLRNADYLVVLLSSGTITISTKDSLIHSSVKGSQLVLDFAAMEKKKDAEEARLVNLMTEFENTPKALQDKKAYGENYQATFEDIIVKKAAIDFAYIKGHPNSYLSLLSLIWHLTTERLGKVDSAFNSLAAPLKQTDLGLAIAKKIDSRKTILIGGKAPNFISSDTTGTKISLSSFKGKYVLVDFWASWCKPCRAENPNVVKAFDTYKDKNFTVLGVSLDKEDDRDKWIKAINDDHLERWTQVSELTGWRSEVVGLYNLKSIPQNVLIDPGGTIIAKNLRGEELQQKLASLFH
ncbi:redoxin domain-containing protein [Chitinophaga oryziterrae]|uniref:Redoxin domain-containing protein n=1 Tax=Chitinophaga oryziterrae TaxID=1031224 RepID=A0A6N8JF40_9BACT|nr:TlpA disulfide reductase family protein [Chitinophaga oryziterrae]MVT42996.1 redoxin domain-containing protein [Chitinophaga oryziterrae]